MIYYYRLKEAFMKSQQKKIGLFFRSLIDADHPLVTMQKNTADGTDEKRIIYNSIKEPFFGNGGDRV